MSIAAAQARKFYEQVVADGRVFTFVEDGSFLVFPVDGGEVVPFWSSASRLDRVRALHPKYRAYDADEIPLADFLAKTLPLLQEERIRVGVNWSGERLVGYDEAVDDLRRNLDYWLTKLRPVEAPPAPITPARPTPRGRES